MRIWFIRLIAVCFLILGLWNVFLFFRGMFISDSANLAYAVVGVILFRTGDNLFSLKETGRKLALLILGINILQIIFTIFLAVSQGNISFTWTGLGASLKSDSMYLFVVLVTPWIFIEVIFGLLLFQEKTKLIFQSK